MTYRKYYWISVLLPTIVIGGFEYVRHNCQLGMSMMAGNLYITLIVLTLSLIYTSWMFRMIKRQNERIAEEQALRAVYEERERLARELHDSIAQTLFFLNIKLKKGQIEESRQAISSIDNQVRQAIFNLRSMPQEGALGTRLQNWLGQWNTLTGIDVQDEIDMPDPPFTSAEEAHIFGIVQEAFNNIRKHARASNASIHLHPLTNGGWQLEIADDGCGFDPVRATAKTYGLSMMTERATKMGASFQIRNRAVGGTALTLTRLPGGKR
ncbi:MAG: sensor histidine kinase [Tumebacillaceae bacterium]